MYQRLIAFLFSFGFVILVSAQSIQISNLAIAEDGTVSFTAQVASKSNARERYQLSVFSSVDNFQHAYVLEDAELVQGTAYDLSFNGNVLVGEYSGQVSFKFQINATVFPLEITDGTDAKLKIGKEYTITWNDFHELGNYKIELLRNGSTYQILQRSFAGTSYTDVLPETIAKGDNYEIKVTPVSNEDLASEPFNVTVTKGVGLAVKLAPIIAVGGGAAVYALTSGGGGDGGGGNGPGGSSDFPSTPGTPGGN